MPSPPKEFPIFKTKNFAPARTVTASWVSPLGGSYVAVFDRPQAAAGVSGGNYTRTGSAVPERAGVDSYVATFDAAGSVPGTRGSYVQYQAR